MTHGKFGTYRAGCRCEPCCLAAKEASRRNVERKRQRKLEARRASAPQEVATHGRYAHDVLGCRCSVCVEAYDRGREASKQAKRKRAQRFREAAPAPKRGEPWTLEELEYIASRPDAPLLDIAVALDRTVPAVEQKRLAIRQTDDLASLVQAPKPTKCSLDGCTLPPESRGLCGTHYARLRKWGDASIVHKPWGTYERPLCELDDCDVPAARLGYCSSHYYRFTRYGSPDYERETRHGTYRYKTFGCRCDVCVEANRERGRRRRLSAAQRSEQAPHGTTTGYSAWSCRCEECRAAWTEYRRQQLANDPEARELARARAKARSDRLYAESLGEAVKHGDEWTGPELEFALRTDLTVHEIASILHRTTYAVQTARGRARHDPKYVAFVGMASE